jgi:hypothetical protein
MKGIPIRYGCSQISDLFHPLKGYITYLYVVILSCVVISRQVYRFARIYCILSYPLPFKVLSAWPTAATTTLPRF